MESESRYQEPRQLGRYTMYGVIGSGGMATVHFGRLLGPSGFARPVAIKRLHEQFASDRDFAEMLIDEAHTASRIAHTNVVPTLDVLAERGELWLVMEYVNGESLARLLDTTGGEPLPVAIAAGLVTGVLHGLHAAHETRNEGGELLGIVHRDVSPDNVLVGVDGVARLADFGVAKARGRVRTTPAGQVKGKLAYMPSEQIRGRGVDRRADVYGAGAVLWETLTGRMLFDGASEGELIHSVLNEPVTPPRELNAEVPTELDAIVLRALSREPAERFATARDMANAIERSLRVASQSEIADWLQQVAGPGLAQRAAQLRTMIDTAAQVDGPSTRVTPYAKRAQSSTRPTTGPTAAKTGRWLAVLLLALSSAAGGYWWLHRAPPPVLAPPVAVTPAVVAPPPEPQVAPPLAKPIIETPPPPAKEKRRRKPAAKAPEVDCSPPYYLDQDGIRHVKTECL
ncbi:MAG TPA: serine/threonine-protein kinase [Polyangiales bacterium]|nr:serine/threonine-protein kinase [Polyangiales bacterium]